jgi:hypothetical protein
MVLIQAGETCKQAMHCRRIQRVLYDLVFKDLKQRGQDLCQTLSKVKTLTGLLPICASRKKIRDDSGYWNQVEKYISEHSDAKFSHGLCPDCFKKYQLQNDSEEKK